MLYGRGSDSRPGHCSAGQRMSSASARTSDRRTDRSSTTMPTARPPLDNWARAQASAQARLIARRRSARPISNTAGSRQGIDALDPCAGGGKRIGQAHLLRRQFEKTRQQYRLPLQTRRDRTHAVSARRQAGPDRAPASSPAPTRIGIRPSYKARGVLAESGSGPPAPAFTSGAPPVEQLPSLGGKRPCPASVDQQRAARAVGGNDAPPGIYRLCRRERLERIADRIRCQRVEPQRFEPGRIGQNRRRHPGAMSPATRLRPRRSARRLRARRRFGVTAMAPSASAA